MPWPSCTLSRNTIRDSHLCEAEPGYPGAITRNGPPCMFDNGWPFMANTSIVCSSIAFLIGTPREMTSCFSSPDRCRSRP